MASILRGFLWDVGEMARRGASSNGFFVKTYRWKGSGLEQHRVETNTFWANDFACTKDARCVTILFDERWCSGKLRKFVFPLLKTDYSDNMMLPFRDTIEECVTVGRSQFPNGPRLMKTRRRILSLSTRVNDDGLFLADFAFIHDENVYVEANDESWIKPYHRCD